VLLKEEAYSKIVNMINDKSIKYNNIYSLSEIAKEINMSRTPVRDAVQQLSSESIIDVLPSRGFQLHRINDTDIIQLYHYSCAVESYCAMQLAVSVQKGRKNKYVKKLEKLFNNLQKLYENGSTYTEFFACDNEFHKVINESLEDEFFNSMNKMKRGFFDHPELHFTESHATKEEILAVHTKIMEAIRSGDPVAAYKAMIEHADLVLSKYQDKNEKNK